MKSSNFITEVVARLKGDDAGVIAALNERKAKAAFKQQLSALESKLVDDEINVADRKDDYNTALYPTAKIADTKGYLENLRRQKEKLEDAEEVHNDTVSSIEFFTAESERAFGK